MYVTPLVVDVTWWAKSEPASSPADQKVPLRQPLDKLVLRLYSMLRRYVDLETPNDSYGEIVVRPGVGIPVELGRPLDTIAADYRSVIDCDPRALRAVVLLLDKHSYDEAFERITKSLETLRDVIDVAEGRVLLLPVAFDKLWNDELMNTAPVRLSFIPEDKRLEHAVSGVGVNLATWLMRAMGSADPKPRVTIFVSHAKLDLAATHSAAIRLQKHIQDDTQIDTFFDTKDIDRGLPIAEQLVTGQRESVLLALRTDNYAESPWCHEEVLTAKALQVPVISVWSVIQEERRTLPYGGNMPTLLWDEERLGDIIQRCLEAWLHHLHFRLYAPSALSLTDIKLPRAFISRPPELVDFALGGLPVDRDALVMYPDPPMPAAETRVLRLAHPRVRLATPTTLFGGAVLSADPAPPLDGRRIALSLSESPQACAAGDGSNVAGFNALHMQDAIAHLTLCIVRAGARLAYGGHLLPGGFTPYLAGIIASHNSLGAIKADRPLVYLAEYLRSAESDIPIVKVDVGDADIRIDSSSELSRKVGEALQVRAMRIRMAVECDARVAIGGKDKGYGGRYPGVVEECWRMLEAGKPIYPVGGFGGAAMLVARALLGETPPALREKDMRAANRAFDDFCTAYDADDRRHDGRGLEKPMREPATLNELAERIGEFGAVLRGQDGDKLWTNGLTVAENRRLFESRDLTEIAHLVMKGLAIILPRTGTPAAPAKGPIVRLFRGSVTDVEAADAYAVPVVSGLAPTGAALALDERLAGRIRDRLQSPIREIEAIDAGGARLAGRSVLLVPLAHTGNVELTVLQAPKQSVQEACEKLVAYAKANKLTSIAVVPFGANIGLQAHASAAALVAEVDRQFRAKPLTITICELLADRYGEIKNGLNVPYTELPASPVATSATTTARTPLVVSVSRQGDLVSISLLPPADDTDAVVERDPRALTVDDRSAIDVYARTLNAPPVERLEKIGLEIASRLFGERQRALLAKHAGRPIDIVHDFEAAAIPWELLAIQEAQRVSFPARDGGMRRRLMVDAKRLSTQRPRRLELGEKLRVLLVVNPRGLSEALEEAKQIKSAFQANANRIELVTLDGTDATVDKVVEALSKPFDVFHYAGHASFDSNNPANSGLHLVDQWLTPDRIVSTGSDAIRIPPLVVLNACTSARVRGQDHPDPVEKPLSPSLAEAILVAGARTFIGTFWNVFDTAAAKFSKELYRRLLSGDSVGTAVLGGRRMLDAEKERDWVNYNLYGDTELRW